MGLLLKEFPITNIWASGYMISFLLKFILYYLKKINSKLSFFYCDRACFTINCRNHFVQAPFLPALDYAVIFMHAALSTLKPLDTVYYSALCFIAVDEF